MNSLLICISLFFNTLSAFFGLELITNYYLWSCGLWIILILFQILNLFVLTNPSYVTHQNNQTKFYWIHVVLYVLLFQGLQTAVSGDAQIFSWQINYFYYFYLLICVEFISVRFAIKSNGVNKPIKKYLSAIISPIIVTYILEQIYQFHNYIYIPLLIWVVIVVLIGIGQIFIINKRIQKGYNQFETKDIYAMAMNFPILMINPFFDDDQ